MLANAGDIDGDNLTAAGLTITAGNGSLVDNNDGTFSFTPDANDDTEVSFEYAILDRTTNVVGSASLDITPVNDPPTLGGFVETRLADLTPLSQSGIVTFLDNAGHQEAQITIDGQSYYQGIGVHPLSLIHI